MVAHREVTGKQDAWYAYHFGEETLRQSHFDPDMLYGESFENCYAMMADLCSFTNFLQATQRILALNSLLTSLYTDARRIIHQHEGMLYLVAGDGVLAIWGLHKQQPSIGNVIACAQELLTLSVSYAEQWQSMIDHYIQPKGMRIGIAKGEIAVMQRDHEYTGLSCIGSVINLATRLQTAAAPNTIVCSNTVKRDIVEDELSLNIQPYVNASGEGFVDTKNYGRIQAWCIDSDC